MIEEAAPEPEPIFLPGPSLDDWPQRLGPTERPSLGPQPNEGPATHVALATDFNAPIFENPGRPQIIGRVRRGNRIAVRPASGPGCSGGRWYRVEEDIGHVCTNAGFAASSDGPIKYPGRQVQPDVTLPVPLDYAEVVTDGAPRLSRLPAPEEADLLGAVARGEVDPDTLGDLVIQRMVGDYFLAIDEKISSNGRSYYRTVKGHYARAEDVQPYESYSEMHGEHLGERHNLPLAFVYGENATIFCHDDGATEGAIEPCGEAEKHARFNVERVLEQGGRTWVESTDGFFVERSAVRIADTIERPERVAEGVKWAHIDLTEQAFVAYEDDRPVFATLVSTGREGYETPAGLWRTSRKYVTRTMRGGNEAIGIWDVEEVPWAMYYNRGWAVHGAYWHGDFGEVKSRGCTNLAPADARWIFHWTVLPVPESWHAVTLRRGTWWYFTRS